MVTTVDLDGRFMYAIAGLLSLVALIVLIAFACKRRWADAGITLLFVFALGSIDGVLADRDARLGGFADAADRANAASAGFHDGGAWRQAAPAVLAQRAAEQAKQAQDAEEEREREAAAQRSREAEAASEAMQAKLADFAERMVRERLKDPASAQIRTIGTRQDTNGHLVVCGAVNARNSFGGYTGEKGFVATPETGSVAIETSGDSKDPAFFIAWTNNCRT